MQMKLKQSLLVALAMLLVSAQPIVARAAGVQGTQGLLGLQSASGLSFYNTHTHESVTIPHRRLTPVSAHALDGLSRVMRDHRSGKAHPVSPQLVNLLGEIQHEILRRHPNQKVVFHIISGFRAPETNARMRASGGGQAKKSRHMFGDAMDIRVPGVSTSELRDIAYCLKRGGVGMYKGSDFVHVDVWNVRTWNWKPTASTCAGGGKATS
jgi:uncharacterized protein YcbK (DUF882 family)